MCGSSPSLSHSSAQRSQTAAHAAQVCPWSSDPRSMKLALVWQISAQSRSRRTMGLVTLGRSALPLEVPGRRLQTDPVAVGAVLDALLDASA